MALVYRLMARRRSRNFRKLIALVLTLVAFVFAREASAASHEGKLDRCLDEACFPLSAVVDGQQLPLRGIATFRYFGFRMYTAALYLPESVKTPSEAFGDTPKYLILHYRRTFTAEDLQKNTQRMLKKNPDVNLDKIKAEVDSLNQNYKQVGEGDRYAIEYSATAGMTLSLNDVVQVKFANCEFANQYFAIWLGTHSVKEDFTKTLFGIE